MNRQESIESKRAIRQAQDKLLKKNMIYMSDVDSGKLLKKQFNIN
jgi:hypothetical protein